MSERIQGNEEDTEEETEEELEEEELEQEELEEKDIHTRSSFDFAMYLKAKIPETEEYNQLRKDIDMFIEDCFFWAPEVLIGSHSWSILTSILNGNLGHKLNPITEEWIQEILKKFSGK
jgi:hypothetical protein